MSGQRFYGKTMVAHLDDLGVLDVVGAAAMLHTLRGEMGDWIGGREAWAVATVNGAGARLAQPIPADTYPARF